MASTVKVLASKCLSLRDFMNIPFRIFAATGLKLIKWDVNDQMTRSELALMIFFTVNFSMCFLANVNFVLFGEFLNAAQFSATIVFISYAQNSVCKVASVWLGRRTVHEVLLELEKHFPKSNSDQKDFRVQYYYKTIVWYSFMLAAVQWFVTVSLSFLPLVHSSLEYFKGWQENGRFVYRTPYFMKYPFDYHKPLPFAFVYFTQLLGGYSVSCFYVGSDLLLVGMVHMLNMQFERLLQRIRAFKAFKNPQKNLSELQSLVEVHKWILNLTQRVNGVFSVSILFSYMITIILVCLMGFRAVIGGNFMELITFFSFMSATLMCVYFQCRFGTILMTLSEEVADAFSSQEWYMADLRYQRMLPLIIGRAQRPAQLTAFKFFPLSMQSFGTLISYSYQIFTLIKTRYDEA